MFNSNNKYVNNNIVNRKYLNKMRAWFEVKYFHI